MAVMTEKSIVYHIPKCGGIWVKEAMRRSGVRYIRCHENGNRHPFGLVREHATPDRTPEADKAGRFAFCFVRQPIGWYKSFWCYRIRTKHLDRKFAADKEWDDSFDQFVVNMLEKYPEGFISRLYQSYSLEDMDYIGRQENLADDLVTALGLASEEFDERKLRQVGRRNISAGHKKYGDLCVLDAETEERMLKTEQWIIDTFYPS